jgi:hypothetical protein
MKFPLTERLLREAAEFELRSACQHCLYWRAARGECLHGWPDDGQRQWPLAGDTAAFCKEFELK